MTDRKLVYLFLIIGIVALFIDMFGSPFKKNDGPI